MWLTQIIFFGLPWLTWGGRPAVWLDLEGRRFYVFSLILYPQDVIYLTAILIISAMALFLFTAVAGRQWCGYACFIYMLRKFVFRKKNAGGNADSACSKCNGCSDGSKGGGCH